METLEINKIHCGDCIKTLKQIESNSVDSIVTDPPYELGFMGKKWDSTGIANNVEMWQECLRVLKPGGHLLAFSGTRTYHRMASAIEDAGFEIRDMIEWVYGSGFPKSLNIGKAVDKLQGNERKKIGTMKRDMSGMASISDDNYVWKKEFDVTKGNSEWEGWGTALKPAHEPICMARKPLAEKTVAENVLKYGTGGINIDESRVEHNEPIKMMKAQSGGDKIYGQSGRRVDMLELKENGRFPANLIHDNSEEVRGCFPNESERFFKSIVYQAKASKSERNRGCGGLEDIEQPKIYADGVWSKKNMGNTPAVKRKPVKNNHPTVKPIALMEYLIEMVTPKGGIVLDPFAGSGTTGLACKNLNRNFILIEKEQEYCKIAEARINK